MGSEDASGNTVDDDELRQVIREVKILLKFFLKPYLKILHQVTPSYTTLTHTPLTTLDVIPLTSDGVLRVSSLSHYTPQPHSATTRLRLRLALSQAQELLRKYPDVTEQLSQRMESGAGTVGNCVTILEKATR